MAKTSGKKAVKPAIPSSKKAQAKKVPAKKSKPASPQIEVACMVALAKLRDLQLDYELQSAIDWCLGSFRVDRNPVGLYEMGERALGVFKAEQAKKTKGVTPKLISDLEKALKSK